MKRKWLSKPDLIIILILAVVAAGALLWQNTASADGAVAEVTIDGETVLELPLSDVTEAQEITLKNGIVLEAKAHTVRFLQSDCPDGLCVKAGVLEKPGDVAACLPNKTVVSIRGGEKSAVDILTY